MPLIRGEGLAGFEGTNRLVVVKLGGQASAHAVVCGKLDGRARLARCRLVEILENSPNDGLVVAELHVQFQLKIGLNSAGGSTLLQCETERP